MDNYQVCQRIRNNIDHYEQELIESRRKIIDITNQQAKIKQRKLEIQHLVRKLQLFSRLATIANKNPKLKAILRTFNVTTVREGVEVGNSKIQTFDNDIRNSISSLFRENEKFKQAQDLLEQSHRARIREKCQF